MVSFGNEVERPLYGRGPSPGLRFTVYALGCMILMYFDGHSRLAQRLRFQLEGAAYPIQVAVSSPGSAWHWLDDSVRTRAQLRAQIAQLQQQLRVSQLSAMRQAALERENAELRGLHAAAPPLISHWQVAEIIGLDTTPVRQRAVINRGLNHGVHLNQTVMDADGVVGQVARLGPWSAEVILVTDPTHSVPVQAPRNGVRTVVTGSGDGDLTLPYLKSDADLHDGDLLVTSGLGGVFPAGLPVAQARVVQHGRDGASVFARPLSHVERDREVMILDFDPGNNAAPVADPPIAPAPTVAAKPTRRPHDPGLDE